MKKLNVTRAEALNIIQFDNFVDEGGDPYPLNEEQNKISKKSRQMNGVNPYGKKTTRIKKSDNEKQDLINYIADNLYKFGAENLDITNDEREIVFYYNQRKFKIVLSAPRN